MATLDRDARIRFQDKPRLQDLVRALAAAGARQIQRRDHRRQHQCSPAVRDPAPAGLLLSRADVRMDRMTPTDHHTFCPYKGTASYWTIAVGDKVAENAVWGYPEPFEEVAAIEDFVAFYWNRVDAWYEEDEEIFVHPRDPYKRVDVLESSRPVQVIVGGEVVAETRRARFLFETRLPTRYYIPPRMCAWICWCRARPPRAAPTRARPATTRSRSATSSSGSRLDLPRPDSGMPQNQRLSLLLQRAGGRDPRRRRAACRGP